MGPSWPFSGSGCNHLLTPGMSVLLSSIRQCLSAWKHVNATFLQQKLADVDVLSCEVEPVPSMQCRSPICKSLCQSSDSVIPNIISLIRYSASMQAMIICCWSSSADHQRLGSKCRCWAFDETIHTSHQSEEPSIHSVNIFFTQAGIFPPKKHKVVEHDKKAKASCIAFGVHINGSFRLFGFLFWSHSFSTFTQR